MPQFNPHNYMDPNPTVRFHNGEYYLYTPTKTVDADGFSYGTGGTVRKLTPEENPRGTYNRNNTFNATIDPETWVKNAQWTQSDFQSGIQNAFGGFDPQNTTGWQGKLDSLVQQASSAYGADPGRGTKVFGDVWNTFRNNNLESIQKLQAQNNPPRPEFTSQEQARVYGQTGQVTTPEQRNQMARGNQQSQPQPAQQYNGPTTTRLNMQTGLLEKVPASSVVADKLPLQVSPTVNPGQLTTTSSPAGLFPAVGGGTASAKTMLDLGNLGLSALDQAIFQFQAQQQELASSQRQAAETALAQAQQGLQNVYNTSRESEISRIMQEAGIKEKQAALSDLKMKMAQAQEALGLGLQQENGRIAPMSILGRRSALLVEQAQGKIGALAAIAAVYNDDLDQAWNVANLTIDAMNQDRQEKIDAYQFLIKANEDKIVNLKAEEKEAINSQIGILKEAQAKAEANKEKVMELITKNPIEAQKGKVSLTDTYEQAIAKMQPLLAKRAETEYNLQLQSAKLDNQYKSAQIENLYSEIGQRNQQNQIVVDTSGRVVLKPEEALKINKEMVNSDAYKSIRKAQDSLQFLNEFEQLFNQTGATSAVFSPRQNAALKAKYNATILNLKEFFNLGVLNGPDEAILKGIIPDPTNRSALLTGLSLGIYKPSAGTKAGIENMKKQIASTLDDRYKSLTSQYGDYSPESLNALSDLQRIYIQQKAVLDPNVQKLINENPSLDSDSIIQIIAQPDQQTTNRPQSFNKPLSVGSSAQRIASAIGQFESGGNYQARGPVVTSGPYKGERAAGKYQIMPGNIPQWSKEALGREVSLKEFLDNPKIQDQIAEYKMGQIYQKYGNVGDVASVWFSGRPIAKAGNAKDVIGTSVPQYVKNVVSIYNKLG